jgi:hypothetical protein
MIKRLRLRAFKQILGFFAVLAVLIDRSGKEETSVTLLIVNDLTGNKIGNRPVTCYWFLAFSWLAFRKRLGCH